MKTKMTASGQHLILNKVCYFLVTLLLNTGFILFLNYPLTANNLTISNVSLVAQNTAGQYTHVQFDIAWDNSWRVSSGPANWDAAWVFVKYRKKTQTSWHHATLHWVDGTGTNDGHTFPATAAISSSNDNGAGGAYGVFIYHSTAMPQGSVSYPAVTLRWDYGVDNILNSDSVEVCVFGIEMVYVSQGSFYVGSGGNETNHFYTYPTTSQPYYITSEAAIPVGAVNGNLYYVKDNGIAGDQSGPVPAAFPKGFRAFYCMKYEITQEQYVAFLNKLDNSQTNNNFPNRNGSDRHTITGSYQNYVTTNPYVACNYLKWHNLLAYLDWAALRPMTELEYEKAARGLAYPVANEYTWGSVDIVSGQYTLANAGATNEDIATGYSGVLGNCAYSTSVATIGPLRPGIFAANSANTGRKTAGASYYGIMELSGNLAELTVGVGYLVYRGYDGQHGDGVLDANGYANTANWPYQTSSLGFGRGGSWYYPASYCTISQRYYPVPATPDRGIGGRGVRTAP